MSDYCQMHKEAILVLLLLLSSLHLIMPGFETANENRGKFFGIFVSKPSSFLENLGLDSQPILIRL